MDLTGRHYTWFQNTDCEYFPCHNDVADFNCLFCYCPLYRMEDCGGGYVLRNGVKDCSFCLMPHNGAEGYAYVLAKLRQANAFAKKDAEAEGQAGGLTLKTLDAALTVCKVSSEADLDLTRPFYFIGKTDQELSLVCRTEDTPANTTDREDGWRGFRIQGTLDFSLIGILSKLTGLLAAHQIGIFAVSTYNTDYILVKEESFDRALAVLSEAGYPVV